MLKPFLDHRLQKQEVGQTQQFSVPCLTGQKKQTWKKFLLILYFTFIVSEKLQKTEKYQKAINTDTIPKEISQTKVFFFLVIETKPPKNMFNL